MKTIIDRTGRIQIPEKLRTKAGLEPGKEVELTWENGAIRVSSKRKYKGRKVHNEDELAALDLPYKSEGAWVAEIEAQLDRKNN